VLATLSADIKRVEAEIAQALEKAVKYEGEGKEVRAARWFSNVEQLRTEKEQLRTEKERQRGTTLAHTSSL
jgi:hypothetical protein